MTAPLQNIFIQIDGNFFDETVLTKTESRSSETQWRVLVELVLGLL